MRFFFFFNLFLVSCRLFSLMINGAFQGKHAIYFYHIYEWPVDRPNLSAEWNKDIIILGVLHMYFVSGKKFQCKISKYF